MTDFTQGLTDMGLGFAGDLASGFAGQAFADSGADHANHLLRQNMDINWRRQKEAAKTSYQRDLRAYSRRYQTTAKDMKSAGLNPILAATSGFNVGSGVKANMPSTNANSASAPSTGTITFGSTAKSLSAAEKDQAQTKLTKKQVISEINKAINLPQ